MCCMIRTSLSCMCNHFSEPRTQRSGVSGMSRYRLLRCAACAARKENEATQIALPASHGYYHLFRRHAFEIQLPKRLQDGVLHVSEQAALHLARAANAARTVRCFDVMAFQLGQHFAGA